MAKFYSYIWYDLRVKILYQLWKEKKFKKKNLNFFEIRSDSSRISEFWKSDPGSGSGAKLSGSATLI